MGTRSLTRVYDSSNRIIINMYRQMDGYPQEHGFDLAKFMEDMEIVNGISPGMPDNIANGVGCFAAQLVTEFKSEIGQIYLYPPDTIDVWEEYIYDIYVPDIGYDINVRITEVGEGIIFEGNPKEMLEWLGWIEKSE
jgi:hypothetical protein